MLVQETNKPPTTNDQYHHSETIWRVTADVICLSILLAASLVSHHLIQPFTRGFFCSDTSIRYPYKDDTIPFYAAVILSVVLPIVWMWTTEFSKRFYFSRYPNQVFLTHLEFCGRRIITITPFVRNLYILTVVFGYGYLSTWILTEITKNFVGELRPHFLAVCQPTIDCSTLSSNQFNSYLQFGINYTCLNTDSGLVRDARRSFFSGHTSPVFFGLGWLIMYIHVSWSWRHLGIIGHMFQTGLVILGLYIGYSRIFDFHHHWNDVLIGGIVGSLVAFVSFKFILNWHHYSPSFLPYTISNKIEKLIPPIDGSSSINTSSGTHRINQNSGFEVHRFNRNDYNRNQNHVEEDHHF